MTDKAYLNNQIPPRPKQLPPPPPVSKGDKRMKDSVWTAIGKLQDQRMVHTKRITELNFGYKKARDVLDECNRQIELIDKQVEKLLGMAPVVEAEATQ